MLSSLEHAVVVLLSSLDGTMGKDWEQVAKEVAEREYPTMVDSAALGALIETAVRVGLVG